MDNFERKLIIKRLIRQKFYKNHQSRIQQLEEILAKQGISRTDINAWAYQRQKQVSLNYYRDGRTSVTQDFDLENTHHKLKVIEGDFNQVILNPKKKHHLIIQYARPDKRYRVNQLYSDTFIATLHASLAVILFITIYSWFFYFLEKSTDITIFNYELSFGAWIVIPLLTGLVYLLNRGRLVYLILPIVVWGWALIPYVQDLNADLVSVRTADFQPAECRRKIRYTFRYYPCIYLDELSKPIKFASGEEIDDIEVISLKYHPHTKHWQDLQFERLGVDKVK